MKTLLLTLLSCILLMLPAAGQSQADMNAQAAEDFRKADQELNQVYKQLTAKLPAGVKARLVEAQLAWIKYRDADAAARASEWEGGSMAPMIYEGTRARTTQQRTREFKEWLEEFNDR